MEKNVKYFRSIVKSVNLEEKTAEVIISDETVDRYKERVLVDSFKKTIRDFMRHPVLLSSHTYRGLTSQIGFFKKLKVDKDAKEVVGVIEYLADMGNKEADWALKLAEKGIAAFSIGFIPKKWKDYEDEDEIKSNGGSCRDFEEIELLEVSQVLIPANPSALQRSFGDPMIKDLAEEVVALFKEHPDEITWEDEESSEEKDLEEDTDEKELELENKKWEETENEIRHRVRDPELFSAFRTIKIKKDKPRVNAIYGKLKDSEEWKVQALRFPKSDGWTMSDAKAWVKAHPDITKFLEDIELDEMEKELIYVYENYLESEITEELNDKLDALAKEISEIKELLKGKEIKEIEKEDNEETKESDAAETIIKEIEEEAIEMEEIFGDEKLAELKNVLFMGKSCDNNETDAIKKFFIDATQELKGIFSESQS